MKKIFKKLKRYTASRSLVGGTCILMAILLLLYLPPLFCELDSTTIHFDRMLKGPTRENIMGTDEFGRDIFSRIVEGGRVSLFIGLQVMIGTSILGTLIALLAGYYSKVDMIVMRFMDIMMAFPSMLLSIALVSIFEGAITSVSIAMIIVYLPRTVRIVRSSILTIREEMYIEAAKSIGTPTHVVLFKHILPGVLPVLIVQETFLFAYAILGEAGLSFVGLGVQPPAPSWGNILNDARPLLREAPWMVLFPGLMIMLSVLALNLIGDGFREVLDPKRQKGQAHE